MRTIPLADHGANQMRREDSARISAVRSFLLTIQGPLYEERPNERRTEDAGATVGKQPWTRRAAPGSLFRRNGAAAVRSLRALGCRWPRRVGTIPATD